MLDYRVQTFLTVYRCRSFTRAAAQLRLSQPAVSQHIKQLEAHYGCPLFEKSARGAEATPAADVLYQHLAAAANDEERLHTELLAVTSAPNTRPPLRFACTRTIGDYVAPAILSRHVAAHPNERVEMHLGNTQELVRDIEEGAIDFALVEGSFDASRFDAFPLSHEPYLAIGRPHLAERLAQSCGNRHTGGSYDCLELEPSTGPSGITRPCAPRTVVSIHDLTSLPLILREPGSGTREILEKHLAARDLAIGSFARTIQVESIPSIKALVAGGCGISFVYRAAVERELAAGQLVDITPLDFAIEHDFCFIWQRGSRFSERYRALARSWRELLEADRTERASR